MTLPRKPVKKTQDTTKVATVIGEELTETLKNYAFWEGLTQAQVLERALIEFLGSRDIKERPEQAKARERQGRKKRKLR